MQMPALFRGKFAKLLAQILCLGPPGEVPKIGERFLVGKQILENVPSLICNALAHILRVSLQNWRPGSDSHWL